MNTPPDFTKIGVRVFRAGMLTGRPSLHCHERSAGFLLFRPIQKYRLLLQEEEDTVLLNQPSFK